MLGLRELVVIAVAPVVLFGFTSEVRAQAATDVDCDACVGTDDIAKQSIGSAKIKKSAVTKGKIKAGAVTKEKLSSGLAGMIDSAITGITIVETALVEDESFAIATCPAGMLAISANCACLGDGETSNWGMLATCAAGDDGAGVQIAVAACDIDFTYDPELPFPQTGVSATCIGLVNEATAAAMGSAKESAAAAVDYQASMGRPTSVVQLRKAADRKKK